MAALAFCVLVDYYVSVSALGSAAFLRCFVNAVFAGRGR